MLNTSSALKYIELRGGRSHENSTKVGAEAFLTTKILFCERRTYHCLFVALEIVIMIIPE